MTFDDPFEALVPKQGELLSNAHWILLALLCSSLIIGIMSDRGRDAVVRTLAVALGVTIAKAIYAGPPPAWWDLQAKATYWIGYSIPTMAVAMLGALIGFYVLSAKTKKVN